MMRLQNSADADIIRGCADPHLCNELLSYAQKQLASANIVMTEPQWTSFVSHIAGMIYRSIYQEKLPAINKEIFSEVSATSLELASLICARLNHIQEDEKYLLSIHFEAAK